MSQADTLIAATTVDADELSLLQDNLSKKLTTLEALNAEIVEITPEDELEDEIGRADEYSERIQRTLIQIRKALKAPPPPAMPPAPVLPTADPSSATPPRDSTSTTREPPDDPDPALHLPSSDPDTSATITNSKVKLPKISLPHFKGNPIYWTAFWDSYESAVHLNSALSAVDKFNYLRSLLEKSAYEAIAGLTLSSANYGEAIEILKKRRDSRA